MDNLKRLLWKKAPGLQIWKLSIVVVKQNLVKVVTIVGEIMEEG